MKPIAILSLSVLLAAACGKKDEGGEAPKASEDTEKPETDKPGEPEAAKAEPDKDSDTSADKGAPAEPDDGIEPLFAFEIPAQPMPYEANEFLWAGYQVAKDGAWTYNMARFKAAKGQWAQVSALGTKLTHSAFLHKATPPDPAALKKGTPVKAHVGVGVKYGRVQSVSGDKVKVQFYVSGPKSGERELPLSSVELWTEAALDPGTPVIYAAGDNKKLATLLHKDGDKVYVIGGKGVEQLDASAVTPIDPSPVFKRGDKVWAYAKKGMGSYKMTEGSITKVHDNGVWYEWKAKEGKQLAKVSFSRVARL